MLTGMEKTNISFFRVVCGGGCTRTRARGVKGATGYGVDGGVSLWIAQGMHRMHRRRRGVLQLFGEGGRAGGPVLPDTRKAHRKKADGFCLAKQSFCQKVLLSVGESG
jgi:hypothetical protein